MSEHVEADADVHSRGFQNRFQASLLNIILLPRYQLRGNTHFKDSRMPNRPSSIAYRDISIMKFLSIPGDCSDLTTRSLAVITYYEDRRRRDHVGNGTCIVSSI